MPTRAGAGAGTAATLDLTLTTRHQHVTDACITHMARDGIWTRGYGYPRVSYPMDMDTGWKTHLWILSGRVPEIHRIGYE
jgi:hypothetical protein